MIRGLRVAIKALDQEIKRETAKRDHAHVQAFANRLRARYAEMLRHQLRAGAPAADGWIRQALKEGGCAPMTRDEARRLEREMFDE